MTSHSGVLDGMLLTLNREWRRMLWLLLPFIAVFAGLQVLEAVAIARMDLWLRVETMETATRYSPVISAVALWLRLCVTGAGIYRIFNAWPDGKTAPAALKFLGFWCAISLALALSLLAIDLWRIELQFSERPTTGEMVRGLWLVSVYGQIILFYLAARLLLGAPRVGRGAPHMWSGAWRATTALQSIGFVLALLVLKLIIDNVFVTVLSYVPFISPFWFIPDELAPYRYLVAQGTRIAAESFGIVFYAAFWIAADRLTGSR